MCRPIQPEGHRRKDRTMLEQSSRRGFLKSLARLAHERGQGLVEFAMITPVILMFMFAIIDFGIGLNHRVVVTNDAREGARYAATGKSVSQVKRYVQDQSEGLVKD